MTRFAVGDLEAVLAFLAVSEQPDRLVPCDIRRIRLGADVLAPVADDVADLVAAAGRGGVPAVTLLVDDTRIARQGADLKADVEARLLERCAVRRHVLTDPHPPLHADERALDEATRAVQGSDAVVTVGGGTITDIGKVAAAAVGVPQVAVQTAASVDGYTDNVSVVLRSGVKRTVPSRWPDVVIADVATISEAPEPMTRAGFGEVTSMFTAPADWRLASLLGVDASWHPTPPRLLTAVGADIGEWAPGIGAGEPAAIERLTWALAVRGIATGVSGGTAVLSGVEHLVSHMLDLDAAAAGRPTGLHGAQVGVAAVVAASAWELLRDRLATSTPQVRLPDPDAARARVEAAFGHIGPAVVAECWRDYSAKLARWADRRGQVEEVVAGWPRHEAELSPLVRSSHDIRSALVDAGAAARFADLAPAVDPDLARWAVTHCALMRNRTTVVDLLDALGWWTAADVEEIVVRAETLTAAAAEGPVG